MPVVVAKEDVGYDALLGILGRWITTPIEWSSLEPFTVLGIDEIALKRAIVISSLCSPPMPPPIASLSWLSCLIG